ncbi:hypothetical protein [Streptomyces sp. SBT349]|uniref:hypothetical protein n=1 Tax=Streptomyces sp. SBT349 TaxID=1580539 RepID=UPI00066B725E|nr:hypothetical protein [Streptomyces sp. SBT349]
MSADRRTAPAPGRIAPARSAFSCIRHPIDFHGSATTTDDQYHQRGLPRFGPGLDEATGGFDAFIDDIEITNG